MSHSALRSTTLQRLTIEVRGVVQGVGFRPFVYNAATARGLRGWVRNETDLVRIEAEGAPVALADFVDVLRHCAPPQARIDSLDVTEIPPIGDTSAEVSFAILTSREIASRRPAVPADLAACSECLAEIRDPAQRRYRYPFTNCTNCGPRWSIIEGVPYDRPRTSMSQFEMCPACRADYDSPADRRFHAQPIACPACGPELRLLNAGGGLLSTRDDALRAAVEAILAGQIVALKGLGGFQLLVDATSDAAVRRLRDRKHRPAKPLAVMIGSLDKIRECCNVSDAEADLLASPAAPIVLLARRRSNQTIAESVAPGNPELGVMLPYTPLHHLLMADVGRPIVCTSGNLSEEPMATATADAIDRLGRIADLILTHNRPIIRPVDDSVVRCDADGPVILRRARGYAPLPIELADTPGSAKAARAAKAVKVAFRSAKVASTDVAPGEAESAEATSSDDAKASHRSTKAPRDFRGAKGDYPGFRETKSDGPIVLAVGGHLKNAVALRLGRQVVVGSHVGDLESPRSFEVFRRAVDDLVSFFDARPDVVACDLHPDYLSTQHAQRLAEQWNAPLVRVQHHHAHAASCIAEHGLTGPVLGLAFDGTGYGTDHTVWGGEALRCNGGTFERLAHLRLFGLPGGDQAVRRPRRSALGVLFAMDPDLAERHAAEWFDDRQRRTLLTMLRHGTQCPMTSSLGRLFDAVATLCGLPKELQTTGDREISFEGEAAMALQFAADENRDETYPVELLKGDPRVVDWEPMVRGVLNDRADGVPIGRISARFHNTLADVTVQLARRSGCAQVALSGGCFQNRLLTEQARRCLSEAGFNVYTHHEVPPGDGGIALGQAYLADLVPRS